MANVKKTNGKNGLSYKITVSMGRNRSGKQVRHYKTFTPPAGMSERKADKEAEKIAFQFEEELRLGFQADNRISFEEYAEYFLKTRSKSGLKRSTCERYKSLLLRIYAGIGHMKLLDIRPQHLNLFYDNLMEEDIRQLPKNAKAKPAFNELLIDQKLSIEKLSHVSAVAASTIRKARMGQAVRWEKAKAVAAALQQPVEALFAYQTEKEPLAPKTVLEHHRLIRTILGQAEKELLIPYNAASKATPPRASRPLVNHFQPQEITAILETLEKEPIKWRTIVHLMIVTGCRRGEIMGLKWEHIDMVHGVICICETLLASDSGVYIDSPKTHDSRRYINIPQETVTLLQYYRQEQAQMRKIVGDRWQETGYVFAQETGLPMHPDSINGWLIKFSARHGLPHINPHAFRHSMASILIHSGTDILSISKRLGHSMTSTTLNFYGHLLQKADAHHPSALQMPFCEGMTIMTQNNMTHRIFYDKMSANDGR